MEGRDRGASEASWAGVSGGDACGNPFSGIPGLEGTHLGKLLGAMKVDPVLESSNPSKPGNESTAKSPLLPAGKPAPNSTSLQRSGEALGQRQPNKSPFVSVVELASGLIPSAQRRQNSAAKTVSASTGDNGRDLRRNQRINGKQPLARRDRSWKFERNGSLREEDYPHIDNIFMGFVMDDDGEHDSIDFKFEALIKKWWPRARRTAVNKRSLKINPHWMNRENFKRWAIRYGYRLGARLARRDPDIGWNHDNCVWVDRNANATWNGKEPPISVNGESVSCSHAASSGLSQVSYVALINRLHSGLSVADALSTPAGRSRRKQNPLAGQIEDSVDADIAVKWDSMRKASANASGNPKARIDGIPGAIDVSGMRYFADKRRRRRIPENAQICREWRTFRGFRDWAKSSGFERGAKLVRVDTSIGWNPYNCYWSYGKDCDSRDKWPIPSLPAGQTSQDGEAGDGDSVDSSGVVGVAESDSTGIIRRSRKDAFMVTAFGEVKQLSDWMKDPRCVIGDAGALRARLRSGWVSERAMTEPVGKRGRPRKSSDAEKINGMKIDATSQSIKENERTACEQGN